MADRPLIAGQYRLAEEIGRGGFGVVWHAHDERLHRDVAAKQLFLPGYLTAEQRHERHARSLREARSAARLHHPNAVTVHDVVMHDDCPWIIMEYVPGRSLDSIVKKEGPLSPLRAAEVGLAVAQALRAAHAAGVIHRDVKPANVLIGEHRIVLTDFGIAMIEGDDSLTQSGLVMGAPAYTSPERARGEPATTASDLWSLGATLYYAVEGRRPFPGANANAVFHAVLTDEPMPVRRAGPLAPIIAGLLHKSPGERLTGAETTARLAKLLGLPPPSVVSPTVDRDPTEPERGLGITRHAAESRYLRRRRTLLAIGAAAATLLLGAALSYRAAHDPPGRGGSHKMRAAVAGSHTPSSAPNLQRAADLPGNGDEADTLAFSPDGNTLAVGSDSGALRLWDPRRHSLLATLTGHRYALFATAFSPDGRLLASGGYDGEVLLWDVPTRSLVSTIGSNGTNGVDSLSFTSDGHQLLIATGSAVRLWNVTESRLTATLSPPNDNLLYGAVSRSGTIAMADGQAVQVVPPGQNAPTRVAALSSSLNGMIFSPDGNAVACAVADGTTRVWDVRTHRLIARLPGTGAPVTAVAYNRTGTLLAAADGSDIVLWKTATHARLAVIPSGHRVEALAFSPDGTLLAATGEGGTVALWNVPRTVP
jgi:serine/threonine protein kinase